MRQLLIALILIVFSFAVIAIAGEPMPVPTAKVVVATPIKTVEDLKNKVVYCKKILVKTKSEEKLCIPQHKANCLCANE